MKNKKMKQGQYAEIMTEIAEHIYRDNIETTIRNYRFVSCEGTKREVDVYTVLKTGEKIAFEVRDRKSTQSISWIDEVVGKYSNSPFNQIWICTFHGCKLSSIAIKKLEYHNIQWRDFKIFNNDNLSKVHPVLIIDGIVPLVDEIEIEVNDKKYKDLEIHSLEKSKGSFKDEKILQLKEIIAQNFNQFQGINFIIFQDKFNLHNIKNNFDSEILDIKTTIQINHQIFVDYFSEEYIVKNNDKNSFLFATKNKSIFITNNTVVINKSFFANLLKEDVILNSKFILSVYGIPENIQKEITTFRLIDVEGTLKEMAITRIFGIK